MSAPPILAARALGRRFGSRVALEGFEFELAAGESVAVFGPNGAGKTTLLRLLTAALRATSGTVRIDGRDPHDEPTDVRSRIGLLSHQTFLYDDLTASENLAFFAAIHGVPSPRERAEAMLAAVGLASRSDDLVRTYSRGMQQRVALARALLHDPVLVFLDEPFGGLDPHAASILRTLLQELRAQGRSLVLTTHDLDEGLDLSDRYVFLSRGRIVASGRSAEADRAALRRGYDEAAAAPRRG